MSNKTTADGFDVAIIGAGHNGLVCAAYLARAGKRVVILEQRNVIGGGATTIEFSPQFHVPACAHLMQGFAPDIIRDLHLRRRGLVLSKMAVPTIALAADGRHIVLGLKNTSAKASIAQHSALDAASYESFEQSLTSIAAAVRPLLLDRPPNPGGPLPAPKALDVADIKVGALDPEERRLARELVFGAIADVLERTFETPLLQGALAFTACLGGSVGPRSPGSGLSFLTRLALERDGDRHLTTVCKGSLGGLTTALGDAAQKRGAQIRTGVTVTAIQLEEGRARGVLLSTGEVVRAPIVVSNADPVHTLLTLLPKGTIGVETRRGIGRFRAQGLAAKVHLAVDGLPEIPGVDVETLGGRFLIAPSIGAIEDALSDAHAGRFSQEPLMEVTIPSIHDPALAPFNQHVLSIIVQYTPYDVEGGWASARDRFAERVLATLGRYMPGIGTRILAGDILTPADLENGVGLPGGHWHHGELAPDQAFWLRPSADTAGYATPVPGLYLCGAGTHPGGGITGLPGRNAAGVILQVERKR